MYNSEQKERFLAAVTNSEHVLNVYRLIFRQTEPYEAAAGRDVCEMTPEDEGCRELATKLVNLRGENRDKRLYLLKQYVRWCVREGIPGASGAFLDVQPAWFERVREKMVGSPMDLRRHLNEVFDPPEMRTVEVVYRCFLWLGFMGVDEDAAIGLSRRGVDPAHHVVRVETEEERKTYPIPDEAMEDFTVCHESNAFYKYNPVVYGEPALIPRADSDQFLRGIRSEIPRDYMLNAVYLRQRKKREGNPRVRSLSYTSVRASGHFWRMYELERAGVSPDFSLLADEDVAQSQKKRGEAQDEHALRQRTNARIRAYSKDYECWKYVYGI